MLESFKDYLIRKLDEDYYLQSAISKVQDLQPQITIHLIKCWLMNRALDYNHWKNEIITWLDAIDSRCNVRTKKGRPSYNSLVRYTYMSEKRILNYIKTVEIQYNVKAKNKEQLVKWALEFWDSLYLNLQNEDLDIIAFLRGFI